MIFLRVRADGAVGRSEAGGTGERGPGVEKGALECVRALSILARRSFGNIGRSFWDKGMPVIATYMACMISVTI
jgi:hypothetical protein